MTAVQIPYGDSTVVAFIYAGFGLALFESTPYVPFRASPSRHSAF